MKRHLPSIAAIIIAGCLCYANTLESPFVFDDIHNITDNPYIRITDINCDSLYQAGFRSPSYRRPLANISFALNCRFGAYDVTGYHFANIAIHIINSILVYLLADVLFRRKRPSAFPATGGTTDDEAISMTRWLPLVAALVFVAHPVQTQSVTYIVQRMNSLCVMFYLVAFLFYLSARTFVQGTRRNLTWSAAILAWLLALGSKEIAITLPFAVFLFEWFFFQNLDRSWLLKHLKYLLLMGLICGFVVLLFLKGSPVEEIVASFAKRSFTLQERLMTQSRVIVFYLSLILLPLPSRMNLLHTITTSRSIVDPVTTVISMALLLGILVLAILIARQHRLTAYCIFWFFLHLAIESTGIGLEMIFEHRLYLPMVGVSLLAAWAVGSFGGTFLYRNSVSLSQGPQSTQRDKAIPASDQSGRSFAEDARVSATSVAVSNQANQQSEIKNQEWPAVFPFLIVIPIILFLAGATVLRNHTWRNQIALLQDVVSKSPESFRAWNNLGYAYAQGGEPDKALKHCMKALWIRPNYADAHYNIGLIHEGKNDTNGAMAHYLKAIEFKPHHALAHNNLALLLENQGNLESAIQHYEAALAHKPSLAEAHNNLGILLESEGKLEQAIDHYRQAIRFKPRFTEAMNNVGITKVKLGDVDAGIAWFRKVLESHPDAADTHNNLGIALTQKGNYEQAIVSFEAALAVDPDHADAIRNRKILLEKTAIQPSER